MTTPPSIAICIPTYKRPDLLTEAIASCLAQTHLPQEILIGDNSPDTATQELVETIARGTTVAIRYIHHVPSLTQALNVDALFNSVQSDILLLLHDDDTLVADCLENMVACLVEHPEIDVLYGKQYMMSHEGQIDYELSDQINRTFYRTSAYAGSKLSALEAVITQQFPNDCYAVKSAIAKKLRYNGKTNHACDFEFGLKLGLADCKLYYLDKYTASYRLSADALSKRSDNNGALIIYQLVEGLSMPPESEKYQREVLEDKAPVAIAQAASLKHRQEAVRIFFSKWHRSKMLSATGAVSFYHLLRAFR